MRSQYDNKWLDHVSGAELFDFTSRPAPHTQTQPICFLWYNNQLPSHRESEHKGGENKQLFQKGGFQEDEGLS